MEDLLIDELSRIGFAAALTVWGLPDQAEIQAGLVMSLLQQNKIDFEPMVALEVLFVVICGAFMLGLP